MKQKQHECDTNFKVSERGETTDFSNHVGGGTTDGRQYEQSTLASQFSRDVVSIESNSRIYDA